MRRRIPWMLAVVVVIAATLTGCATLFGSSVQQVQFDSEPQGATVRIDGQKKGETPLKVELDADKTYDVRFEKQGYEDAYSTLSRSPGAGWIILDLALGGWPLLIDFITADLYSFDEDQVIAKLEKAGGQEEVPGDRPDSDVSAKTLFKRAARQYKKEKYRKALKNFKAAHRRAPSPVLQYNIALTYSKLGRPKKVLATASRIDNPGELSEKYRTKLQALIEASRVVLRARTDDDS